jgi:hypothetical protein
MLRLPRCGQIGVDSCLVLGGVVVGRDLRRAGALVQRLLLEQVRDRTASVHVPSVLESVIW